MGLRIIIEAVVYTPGQEAVHVHYAGAPGTTGPMAGHRIFHTTQNDLSALSGSPGYWSDVELTAALAAHLTEHGIAAEIALAQVTRPVRLPPERRVPSGPPIKALEGPPLEFDPYLDKPKT